LEQGCSTTDEAECMKYGELIYGDESELSKVRARVLCRGLKRAQRFTAAVVPWGVS
jgi:hypothetical protein